MSDKPELPDRDYDFDEVMETFRQDGSLMRAKARIILEERFLPEAYRRLCDTDLPTSALTDLVKLLVEIGDVKPKPSNTPTQGVGFSITINIPDRAEPVTLEAVAVSSDEHGMPAEHSTHDTPPTLPVETNFNGPAMDFAFDAPSSVPAIPDHSGASDED